MVDRMEESNPYALSPSTNDRQARVNRSQFRESISMDMWAGVPTPRTPIPRTPIPRTRIPRVRLTLRRREVKKAYPQFSTIEYGAFACFGQSCVDSRKIHSVIHGYTTRQQ